MKKKLSREVVVVILTTLITTSSFAQKGIDYQKKLDSDPRVEKMILSQELKTPSVIRLAPSSKISLVQTPGLLKELYGADKNVQFYKIDYAGQTNIKGTSETSKTGIFTEKFQQYFKGVKVQHGVVNALMNGDKAEAFTGEYYDLGNLNITPGITEEQALASAKNYVGATKYAWEQARDARDNETNPIRKQLYNEAYLKLLPHATLVIVKDYDKVSPTDIAYRFDIYAAAPMSRAWVYVNAHNGKIMLYDKIIKHLQPDQKHDVAFNGIVPEVAFILSGNAELNRSAKTQAPSAVGDTATVGILTRYVGTRLMGTTNVSGTENDPSGNEATIVNSNNGVPFLPGQNPWVLIDKRFHGVGSTQREETYDLNGVGGLPISVPAYGTARSFTDLDNNWTTLEHKRGGNDEAENDDFAFDAHWGAGIVYQYWKNIHGRLSFDNLNSSIKSYVHSGVAYDNAFWNGSVMTYGDGSFQGGAQAGFAPLVALDVCAHEVGHGVATFTSDLVYANESGGMNEGYSDIWAACVENYALQNVDPNLIASASFPNGFKIWDIGEQIDANDATGVAPNLMDVPANDPNHTALRYMDTPGKANNPGSYAEATNEFNGGAERWTEVPCTGGPTLANDQCGVHNNSGVLNHAFYYLVAGSGGSKTVNARQALLDAAHGPQAATAGAPYNVTGIGFAKAEKIFYLAELNLTPNATFLDQRNAAVLAAEVLYGKCSFEWKQTIIAYNGVAIGKSSDTAVCSSLPLFNAAISKLSISETSVKSAENCTDAVQNILLSVSLLSPGVPNPVTITITPTGSATSGKDYVLGSTTITYAANETGLKSTTIAVYNDAEIEGVETADFAIHAEDGSGFVADKTLNLTIADDDATPVIGTGRTALLPLQNFESTTGATLPAGWSFKDVLTPATISWYVNTPPAGYAFSGKAAFVAIDLTPTTPSYEAAVGGEITLVTPNIDARGKSNIIAKFKFAAGGEPDPEVGALDFGRLQYSFDDGVTFQNFSDSNSKRYAIQPTARLDSVILPAFFNNRQFKLGFNWYNDANIAVIPGFIIDDVEVTGGTQKIESQKDNAVSELQFAGKDIYYLSAQDGELIARIQNPTVDIGCTQTIISEAGNGIAADGFTYDGVVYGRTVKVVKITPSAANSTATYSVTLYFTVAEMGTINPATVKLLKVDNGTPFSGSIPTGNGSLQTPVYEDHSADGYYSYTATFTGFSQFTAVFPNGVLPQQLLSFDAAAKENKYIQISWSATEEQTGRYILERAVRGSNNFVNIYQINLKNLAGVQQYSYNDQTVSKGIVYQYRLRIEYTNSVKFSEIKLASIDGNSYNVEVSPNPSTGIFYAKNNSFTGNTTFIIYSSKGEKVLSKRQFTTPGSVVTIDLSSKASGMYLLKIQTDKNEQTLKLIVE